MKVTSTQQRLDKLAQKGEKKVGRLSRTEYKVLQQQRPVAIGLVRFVPVETAAIWRIVLRKTFHKLKGYGEFFM